MAIADEMFHVDDEFKVGLDTRVLLFAKLVNGGGTGRVVVVVIVTEEPELGTIEETAMLLELRERGVEDGRLLLGIEVETLDVGNPGTDDFVTDGSAPLTEEL